MVKQQQAQIAWVSLAHHRIPWTAEGLARARALVRRRQAQLEAEGWVALRGPEDEGVLQRSQGLAGPMVSGARLELCRASDETV